MKKLFALLLILTPAALFAGPDPRGILELEGYANSDATGIMSKRGRNDFTIKEPLAANDKLFFINAHGYNGTVFTATPRGQIAINANEDWTSTGNGTYVGVQVTSNTSTAMSEAVRIKNIGASILRITPDLDISITTPTAVGDLGITSAGVLYVATSAVTLNSWVKVGAQ